VSDVEGFKPPTRRRTYPSLCIQCGGAVEPGITVLVYADESGAFKFVRGVPVGICRARGEKHITADTARKIEAILSMPPTSKDAVPVWEFAETA
jgi:hypothetical protein